MTRTTYPGLSPSAVRVIVAAGPGQLVTSELIGRAIGDAAGVAAVLADLRAAHMVDDNDALTPLAEAYARMWREHLAKA